MKENKEEFVTFQRKVAYRFFGIAIISVFLVIGLYLFLWKRRGGNWIIYLLEHFMQIGYEEAFSIYHNAFRAYKEVFFATAIIIVFLVLLLLLFRWLTRYFREINGEIGRAHV